MARIRTIKPDFFTSDTVSALPLRARLTWIGLWTHCDDQGRCRDNVRLIKAAVWPLDDVSLRDIDEDLSILANYGRIVRYTSTVDGKYAALIQVVNWDEHQRINRPSKLRFPPPPRELTESSVNGHGGKTSNPQGYPQSAGKRDSLSPHETLTEDSSQERKGTGNREGERASERPPTRCTRHANIEHPPPCRACGDARQAAEAWDRTESQIAAEARSADVRNQAELRARAIADCPLCDANGYAGRVLCDHDPAAPERAARGRAAVQAALTKRAPEAAS